MKSNMKKERGFSQKGDLLQLNYLKKWKIRRGRKRRLNCRNRVFDEFDQKMIMMMSLSWRKTGGLNSSFLQLPLFVAFY